MTKRSTPASTTVFANSSVRCGDSAPATVTPASRISAIRCGDQLGLDRLGVDLLHPPGGLGVASSPAISASSGSGSSYRVHSPSRLSTPRPPSWPSAIAVAGDITESIGAASTGMLEAVGVDLPGDRDLLGVAGAPARARSRCRRRSRRVRPRLPRPISISVMSATGGAAAVAQRRVVVGRLDGHLDVVRVALLEPGRGDPDEPARAPAARGWCARRRRTSTGAGRRSAGARRRDSGPR